MIDEKDLRPDMAEFITSHGHGRALRDYPLLDRIETGADFVREIRAMWDAGWRDPLMMARQVVDDCAKRRQYPGILAMQPVVEQEVIRLIEAGGGPIDPNTGKLDEAWATSPWLHLLSKGLL